MRQESKSSNRAANSKENDMDQGLVNSSQQAMIAEGWQMAAEAFLDAGRDLGATMTAPNVVYKPKLFRDGASWCALYGENLQEGIAGFGDSPAEAMANFDVAWAKKVDHAS